METTFEEKRLSVVKTDEVLERALRGKRGRLTKADAIAASGLPSHLVDESLDRLLRRYRSHLEVTEEGELLYSFEPGLQRRDVPTFRERLAAFGRAAARVGKVVFKVWITVTLILYVVAFLVLALAAMFGGRDDNRRRRDDDFGLGWIFWFLWPNWHYGRYGYGGGYGGGYPYPPRRTRLPGGKKLIQQVFDFVFGPNPPRPDALADEREVLAYLRANDGRVTATDLVALFGWSYRRAEEEVTRLLVDYDGDPEVTDEGVIIYSFPKLLKSAEEPAAPSAAVWKACWQKLETRPILTGNTRTADVVIAAFGGFNLFASFFAAGWARMRFGLAGPTWDFLLTTFPLAFFSLFLGIPLLRAVARHIGDRGRGARNQQRRLIHEVLRRDGAPLPVGPGSKDLALALEGDMDVDEKGEAYVKFPRIAEEKKALKAFVAKLDLPAERKVGQVIFGDVDEPAQLPPRN